MIFLKIIIIIIIISTRHIIINYMELLNILLSEKICALFFYCSESQSLFHFFPLQS